MTVDDAKTIVVCIMAFVVFVKSHTESNMAGSVMGVWLRVERWRKDMVYSWDDGGLGELGNSDDNVADGDVQHGGGDRVPWRVP
jgi:hypothetical protein